ncbi:NADPH-dependent curcumin reductase CurA [Variovorax sp. NFACC28]|nr:NADPH-dependent curcumin reductase CurA [Variovorax sp. NFACC28]SEG99363.1 NADPH-dependent curcumin reductase CurA [Variovorax sp. NFACC29]SFE23247.1 NADPH-dependent curcumin reductase CurA [Variovorax sp. NFACC26]SFH27613.1 NADPH-dependent curcumin reductase CurA [Variovorax sp. NFACC27]
MNLGFPSGTAIAEKTHRRDERADIPNEDKPIVFLFSGQGSQYYHMGLDLYESDARFRHHLDALEEMARDLCGQSILALIRDARRTPSDPFTDVPTSSVAIYLVERALTRCLADHGIEPAMCVGSSMGLYASFTAAGCLSEEEALRFVFEQGRAFAETCEPGGMIAVLGDPAIYRSEPELQRVADLAGINFDKAFVVSARAGDLPVLFALLKSLKLAHQELPVARPFHSRWIEPAKARFEALSVPFVGRRPRIAVACCTRQDFVDRIEVSGFWSTVRNPIMFRETVQRLEASGPCRYVDVGPSGTMATMLKYVLPPGSGSEHRSILSPFGPGAKRLADLIAALRTSRAASGPAQRAEVSKPSGGAHGSASIQNPGHSMPTINRQILLVSRPSGAPSADNFKLVETPLGPLRDREVLVHNHFLSLDPYMRGRMSDAKSYAEPQPLDQVMLGATAGEVLESRHPLFKVGDKVMGMGGWQEFATIDADQRGALQKVDATRLPLSAYLGAVGMPGVAAWYGLVRIIAPIAGETVVVSSAAGLVGGVVGQLAKARGCRVVGIAGGPEKCRSVVEELGFDACVDHRRYPDLKSMSGALEAACPNGIDGYFENVGGMLLDAVMLCANNLARIALCGMIAGYNGEPTPMAQPQLMLTKRMKAQGFIVIEHVEAWPEALKELGAMVTAGKLKYRETITQGIQNAPDAFFGMLQGKRHGKHLVKF